MGQLVRDQAPSLPRRGVKPTGAEYDVAAYGVGMGIDVLRRLHRNRVRMDSHVRKVVSEAFLHVSAQPRFQGPTGILQCPVYAGWRRIQGGIR